MIAYQQGSDANGMPNARGRRTVRGYVVPVILTRRKLRQYLRYNARATSNIFRKRYLVGLI